MAAGVAGFQGADGDRLMYGKIFDSIYKGTLYGHWEALVTFQQLIVLADADGVVDMTPQAIGAHTSIPIEIIEKGLKKLAEPDPHSRTPGEEGRRIVCIDEHRPWGWQIVNHLKYKHLRDSGEVREQNKIRAQRFRDKRNAPSRSVTLSNAESRYTDTDTDTKVKSTVGLAPDAAPPKRLNGKDQVKTKALRLQAIEILTFLNEKSGHSYQPVAVNVDMIVARLREGATLDDCRAIVAKKCREWKTDEKMAAFLRPGTLFARGNFWQKYHGELIRQEGVA